MIPTSLRCAFGGNLPCVRRVVPPLTPALGLCLSLSLAAACANREGAERPVGRSPFGESETSQQQNAAHGGDDHATGGDDAADGGGRDAEMPDPTADADARDDDAGSDLPTQDAAANPPPPPPPTPRTEPGPLDCASVAGMIACTDFDDTFPSSVSVRTLAGTVSISQGHVIARSQTAGGYAALDFPVPRTISGELHLSAWVLVPAGYAIAGLNIVGLQSTLLSESAIDVNLIRPGIVEIFADEAKQTRHAPDFEVPRDRWLCLRARLGVDETQGSFTMSLDGQELFSLQDIDTVPFQGVDLLSVGLDWTGYDQEPAEVHVDSVVLSSEPLPDGCL